MSSAGGRSGPEYEALKRWVWRTYTHCWLCGKHVDQALPKNDRMARTLDHVVPLNTARNPAHRRQLLLDKNNARLAHRSCNSARGDALVASNPSRQW